MPWCSTTEPASLLSWSSRESASGPTWSWLSKPGSRCQGILVDEWLESSEPGIFAAGDVARWIDPSFGERVWVEHWVEHWVIAQRMGQTADRNMLGRREPFDAMPFFWSQHYDVPIAYVGLGTGWDRAVDDGDPAARDCTVTYFRGDRAVATATIFRDRESLETEVALEQVTAHH